MKRVLSLLIAAIMCAGLVHAQDESSFLIRKVSSDKLLYDTGETVTVTVTVANTGDRGRDGLLRVRLVWEMDEGIELMREAVSLGPGEERVFTCSWESEEVLGCEALAELVEAGKVVSSADDYFNVVDPGDALRVSIHSNDNGDGGNIMRRKYYVNMLEVSEPRDAGVGQVPEGEEWHAHYVWMKKKELQKLPRNPHGKKVLVYATGFTFRSEGADFYLDHPEMVLTGPDGGPQGHFDMKGFDTDARFARWKRGFPAGNFGVFLDYGSLKTLDWSINHLIEAKKMFGWHGVRYDGHFILLEGYPFWTVDGKMYSEEEKDRINVRNTRLTEEKIKKVFPDFLFYYNGEPILSPPGDLAERLSGHGLTGSETTRHTAHVTSPWYKWSEMYRLFGEGTEVCRKYGGYYSAIIPYPWDHRNAELNRMMYGMLFATGGHPWCAQPYPRKDLFPDDPDIITRNTVPFFKMATRYSAMLWGKGIERVRDPQSWITVKVPGGGELWWERTVDTRITIGGKKLVIINLVNKPPTEDNLGNLQELPEPVHNVEVSLSPQTGERIVKVWDIRAYPDPGQEELAIRERDGTYSVTVPVIECYRMVVVQLEPGMGERRR